jgi:hypothetical protein
LQTPSAAESDHEEKPDFVLTMFALPAVCAASGQSRFVDKPLVRQTLDSFRQDSARICEQMKLDGLPVTTCRTYGELMNQQHDREYLEDRLQVPRQKSGD